MKTLSSYGIWGILRLTKDWLLTRILFRRARLIRFPIYVRGRSGMQIGEGLTTGVGVRLDAFPEKKNHVSLKIGKHVQLNDAVHIGAVVHVEIGDYTLIASRVFISDHNHGSYNDLHIGSNPNEPPIDRPVVSKPVKIGSKVWIGQQVCILPGVTIGDGAIIGAGAIVTKNVPAFSVAVGNPSKVIRRFDIISGEWKLV